jgi:hypothetical protein
MFTLNPNKREPFDAFHVLLVPRASGVYVVSDLSGPIHVGRSRVDIRRRLLTHLRGKGNRNIAFGRRVGAAASLDFTYCCLRPEEQADVERILIASFGVATLANLRREGTFEEDDGLETF